MNGKKENNNNRNQIGSNGSQNNDKGNSKAGNGTPNNGKWLVILSGWLLCIIVFAAGIYSVFRISGKSNLKKRASDYETEMKKATPEDVMAWNERKSGNWEKGQIGYGEKNYRYNSDIMNFLFMVIDRGKSDEPEEGYGNGRQAGALFLLVLDPHEKAMKLISINRETVTEVEVYDEAGGYVGKMQAPVGEQFGFGDGKQESCRHQVNAVRKLLCDIPIHGYLAVDMDAIPDITDLAGGVDLEVMEDVENGQGKVILKKGAHAHLDGGAAYWYVSSRGSTEGLFPVRDGRLERQKQFLLEFVRKVKNMTKKDIMVPVKIYNAISGRMVTDITADEVFYLAAIAGEYRFDGNRIFTVPGEWSSGQEKGDGKTAEFYADGNALFELVLDMFYEAAE